jgi:two-component system OmpR family response regulator
VSEPSRGTVLVADDDADILELVSLRVERLGFEVIKAANGGEALELARTGKPDLLILDVLMPEINGFEVLKQLRADGGPAAPALILTATIQDERVAREYGIEPEGYMRKPFTGEALAAQIDRLLA